MLFLHTLCYCTEGNTSFFNARLKKKVKNKPNWHRIVQIQQTNDIKVDFSPQ